MVDITCVCMIDCVFGMQQSITDAVESDLSLMDGIVLPIAFLVMAVVVKSLRLLFIPLVCIGLSVLLSFACVYFMTLGMTILSFVRATHIHIIHTHALPLRAVLCHCV